MWDRFASLAAQYYLSGRDSALRGSVPVCGNLFHHAIELQLKCAFVKAGLPTPNIDRYLYKHFGHSLEVLWAAFKPWNAADDLSQFDHLIAVLDPWEEIRYPTEQRAAMYVQARGVPPSGPIASGLSMTGVKRYTLHLEEVDRFVERIWFLIGIDPTTLGIAIPADQDPVVASVYEDPNIRLIHA